MNILDNIQKCEEISCQGSLNCMFRIVEHTNYYLSSVLADNGYRVEKCCVVGDLYLMGTGSCLCESEMQKCRLFLKQGKGTETVEYVMAEPDITIGIKKQNLSGQAFLRPIFTAAINRRRNPLKTGGFKKWIYRMKNVSW